MRLSNRRANTAFLFAVSFIASHSYGSTVQWFNNALEDEWWHNVGDVTTIDFTQFAPGTPLSDHYGHLGVTFSNPTNGIVLSNETGLYVNDGFGLRGINGAWIHFDQPMNWIAADFPGALGYELYSGDELIYQSFEFSGIGAGQFGGLISSIAFDRVFLWRLAGGPHNDFLVSIDDLHFGAFVPAPGALGVFTIALLLNRRRRRSLACPAYHSRACRTAHCASCCVTCAALFVVTAIGGATSRAAAGTSCDKWNATPGQPGMNHIVRALETFNGELYAGGWFTSAGGQPINYIARRDATTGDWHELDGGPDGQMSLTHSILDLTVYDGLLVAAAGFTSDLGSQFVQSLGAWDGEQWQSIGPGVLVNYGTWALGVYQGDLIVAGEFQYTGDLQLVNHIARWDGEHWHSMGGGFGLLNIARTMTVHDGDLYVGGPIFFAGGVPVNKLTRWDGAQWHDVGGGVHGPGSTVDALISYNGELIVAGQFDAVGPAGATTPANHIARWDGENWRPMGSGINYWVRDLVIYQDTLIAAGHFTTASGNEVNHIMWWDIDSEQWQPLGNGVGTNHFIQSLGVYNGALVMGGFFTEAGGEEANYIAMWTGCLGDEVPIPGDLNGDGVVNVSDLLLLLGEWGECPIPANCPADLSGDGEVNVSDLLLLLANWG